MTRRYQDIYPEDPIVESGSVVHPSAADLLTLEYFEAEPGEMPEDVYDQHHILLNLKDEPQRLENWRDGEHRDFTYRTFDIVVTPSGVRSGWRWHTRSKVIVVTLEPEKLGRFAQRELGILLTRSQLLDRPLFNDPDLCKAGMMLRDALTGDPLGSGVLFESLARVFLVKLLQRYGDRAGIEGEGPGLSAEQYRTVLDRVEERLGEKISVEEMASAAALSPSHFARVFKDTVGQTPMQFVTAYRIDRSKKLIASSGAPLARIALQCGFADQAHFTRTFRRLEGVTPKEFRDGLGS